MTVRALLCDVDGTLVDSTYLHVDTWWRAFDEVGVAVTHVAVHERIGKDGSTLVSEILDRAGVADDEREDIAVAAEELHSRYYSQACERLRVLPGARDLLRGAHERGITVVLATSSRPEEFDRARTVLDVDDVIDAHTTGDDVDKAKPEPTIVEIALARAGVDAADALFVGDATWDAVAAVRAGVRSVAVRTGGIGDDALLEAGHERVVEDAGAVLALLD